jgi:hypothetical protein
VVGAAVGVSVVGVAVGETEGDAVVGAGEGEVVVAVGAAEEMVGEAVCDVGDAVVGEAVEGDTGRELVVGEAEGESVGADVTGSADDVRPTRSQARAVIGFAVPTAVEEGSRA